MSSLNKVYSIAVDIKNVEGKYSSYAKFFDDDRDTSIIKIKLLNNNYPIDLEGCTVEAEFILANNTYHDETCKIINTSEGIVELQLCQECLVAGKNTVRLSILKENEIANTPVITYEVKKGLYSDNPNFNDDPLTPVLSQMLLDVKVTKANQIELQERYEQSFPRIELKVKEVDEKIKEVNLAIASGTQDLEVKEARANKKGIVYAKLGDRLDAVDSQLEQSVYHIQNIKTEKFRDEKSNTTYYITEIKRIDEDGEIIKPKLGIANDTYNNGVPETCRSFAKRHNATAVFNGGFFSMDNNTINTLFIKDGIILNNGEYKNPNTNRILVWNDEGFLSQVETKYTANEILDMGYTNALCGTVCLLDKGKPVTTGSSIGNPHQVIAQRENGDIVFLTSLGRLDNEPGMSYNDFIRILQSYNVTFAYSLDGGGSVSSVVNGVKINENIDDNGYTDRPVVNFIYFEKEKKVNKTTDITNIHNMIGDLDQHIKKVVLDVLNKNTINNRVLNLKSDDSNTFIIKNYLNDEHVGSFGMSDERIYYYDMVKNETRFEVDNNGQIFTPKGKLGRFNNTPFNINTQEDLDNLKESGMFWVSSSIGASIGNHAIVHGLISFYISDTSRMQIAIPFDERTVSTPKYRRTNGSSWYPWIDL